MEALAQLPCYTQSLPGSQSSHIGVRIRLEVAVSAIATSDENHEAAIVTVLFLASSSGFNLGFNSLVAAKRAAHKRQGLAKGLHPFDFIVYPP